VGRELPARRQTLARARLDAEKTYRIGDVVITDETPNLVFRYDVPDPFGTALSLTAQVDGAGTVPEVHKAHYLCWSVADTLDAKNWFLLGPIGGTAYRYYSSDSMSGNLRLHGPFTNRLAVHIFFKEGSDMKGRALTGHWRDVVLRLGVQFA
jgi:hypothetical protein